MSIFPSSPSVGDEYSGYRWTGTVWEVIGIDLNADYATTSDLSAHEADSTNIHGISDTGALVVGDGITDIIALTQAAYDALTPDANTLYVITD